jgi:hypothetical protein
VLQNELHDRSYFGGTALFRSNTRDVRDVVVRKSWHTSRTGKRYEPVGVDVPIRKRDERFIAASVVPIERPWRFEKCRHKVEDALEAGNFCGLGLVAFSFARREEGRGRELVSVPRDDSPLSTEQGGSRILGKHLTGLVEHHDVEERPIR